MSNTVPALRIVPNEDNDDEIDSQKYLQLIQSYSHETLKSTERMLEYCGISENTGVKTLMLLDEQGEKLKRANMSLDVIENNLDSVENNLNALEFNCCCCCNSRRKNESIFSCCLGFKRKCRFCKKTDSCSTNLNLNSKQIQPSQLQSANGGSLINLSKYDKNNSLFKINSNMNLTQQLNNEEKIAQNLKQLIGSLDTLNNIAQTVGVELNGQIKQIKVISQHANVTVNQVHDADKIGRRIINK